MLVIRTFFWDELNRCKNGISSSLGAALFFIVCSVCRFWIKSLCLPWSSVWWFNMVGQNFSSINSTTVKFFIRVFFFTNSDYSNEAMSASWIFPSLESLHSLNTPKSGSSPILVWRVLFMGTFEGAPEWTATFWTRKVWMTCDYEKMVWIGIFTSHLEKGPQPGYWPQTIAETVISHGVVN